ncbi:hypothetical protein L7F22_028536 [Adiantum nelumboides]|nr:hypothetical protein [Adiantum nelumboides]
MRYKGEDKIGQTSKILLVEKNAGDRNDGGGSRTKSIWFFGEYAHEKRPSGGARKKSPSPPPNNYKGVQRFMGHVDYYRRFILLFAEIAHPLYKLLIEFNWIKECDQAYEVLKKTLASAPILRAPDWNLIFHVHIDASNFVIGCVLIQPREHKLDYPISFASRQLNNAEKNYTTTEREDLAMIYLVKKF